MSVRINNIQKLPAMDRMKLVAGSGGMDRIVTTVGIADYEFTEGFEDRDEYIFEEDGFVISSLLFAKDAPEKILPAVQALYEYGTAGFAFKNVIFDELPEEVLKFADQHDYPVFVFGRDLFFEDIVYRIIAAVHKEDSSYLSEENLKKMIEGKMTPYEIEETATGVSLLFKKYVRAAYIKSVSSGDSIDAERAIRTFSLSKNLKHKGMIVGFGEGLFVLMTSSQKDENAFGLILKEILEVSALPADDIKVYRSGIHTPFDELDMCIRESYHTYEAEKAEGRCFVKYDEIGTYKYLIPMKEQPVVREFSRGFLAKFEGKDELLETLCQYVRCEGDVVRTAHMLCCHQNTVRYRLSKAKALAGMDEHGDSHFYEQAAAAVKIKWLNDL